jgi:hypothetical protein
VYFVFIYENKRMKPVQSVLRREEEGERENEGGRNLRYIVSTYANISMYPPFSYYMLINFFLNKQ